MKEREEFEEWWEENGNDSSMLVKSYAVRAWQSALSSAATPEQKRQAFEVYINHQYPGEHNSTLRISLLTQTIFFDLWQGATQSTWYDSAPTYAGEL